MVWRPNVTVAAVVERDGRFLLVEEETSNGLQLNQPAGHLEPDESIATAVQREVLEETAYDFSPEQITGIYRWTKPDSDLTYLRFTFAGRLGQHYPDRSLDAGIVRALWMSREEVLDSVARHRTPLVVRCMEDYLSGKRYAIDALIDCGEQNLSARSGNTGNGGKL
jgi:8-oxo-dGTP pyrophosphatase MutT (NUDIX family)